MSTKVVSRVPSSKQTLRSLQEVLSGIRAKIDQDGIRFRTCCTDPRASK